MQTATFTPIRHHPKKLTIVAPVVILIVLMGSMVKARATTTAAPVAAVIGSDGSGFSFGVENVINVDVRNDAFNPPPAQMVVVQLDATTAKRFDEITTANVGKAISIQVCGKVVFKPYIQRPLDLSFILLPGHSKENAQEIEDVLMGRRSCGNLGD